MSNKPGKYYWIPASLDTFGRGISLSVKYRGKYDTSKHMQLKDDGALRTIELADRTIYVTRGYTKPYEQRPAPHDVDETLDLDISTNPHLLKAVGLDFIMVNASAISDRYSFVDYSRENVDSPHILADSGGYQLTIGTEDWLEPNAIIEKQNRVCDIGVVLDIPIKPYLHKFFLARAARVQRYNNRITRKKKAPHVQLMNAFHGVDLPTLRRFREAVEAENESIDRCAIGGLLTQDLFTTCINILGVLLEGRKYKQYHLLGISGLDKTLLLAYMAAIGLAPVITADSSKHIQLGINKKFSVADTFAYAIDLGDKNKGVNNYTPIPCSCNACAMVKYMKAYTLRGMDTLTTYHNLIVHNQQVQVMNELMQQPRQEIMSYLAAMMKTTNMDKLKAVSQCLDIIDYAAQHSVDKAVVKFSHVLEHAKYSRQTGGLFHSGDQLSPEWIKEGQRYHRILKAYEEYHGLPSPKAPF